MDGSKAKPDCESCPLSNQTMSGNTEHSDEYASDGKSEGSQGSGMGSEQEMGRGLVQFRGDSDGEEEMDDEEDEHDRLGHLQDGAQVSAKDARNY